MSPVADDPRVEEACVEWGKGRDANGYGWVRHNGKMARAHRVAWEDAHGPIPAGLVVMHICDNPPCIRVDHLRLGTVADNNRDRKDKGRSRNGHTDKSHCASGHEFNPENTYVRPSSGQRECRECKRIYDRSRVPRQRGAA